MNQHSNSFEKSVLSRDRRFCSKTFSSGQNQIVNNYRCHQKRFTASDLWNVAQGKKPVSASIF